MSGTLTQSGGSAKMQPGSAPRRPRSDKRRNVVGAEACLPQDLPRVFAKVRRRANRWAFAIEQHGHTGVAQRPGRGVDLGEKAAGTYFLKIEMASGTFTRQVVKN